MNKGFLVSQTKMLTSPLDETKVQKRELGGRTLLYIEGWFAVAEANAIFGYDGWDRQTVALDRVYERTRNGVTSCAYTARVRITVRARAQLVVREGTGFAQASAEVAGDAHERAMKAAETDATKRALMTFGGRFGLSLYDKDCRDGIERVGTSRPANRNGELSDHKESARHPERPCDRQSQFGGDGTVSGCAARGGGAAADADQTASLRAVPGSGATKDGFCLVTANGEVWPVASPESYCSGLRQFLEGARSLEEVHRLRKGNMSGLSRLRGVEGLVNSRGEHFADILERLLAKRAKELQLAGSPMPHSRADGGATTDRGANVADLQAGRANGVSGDQSDVPSSHADVRVNEIGHDQSRDDLARIAKAGGEIHEFAPAIGVGIVGPDSAQEAEKLGAEQVLLGQFGLPVGGGPVMALEALENPDQAALSSSRPEGTDFDCTADAPAPNSLAVTSPPSQPIEPPAATPGQDLAICEESVKLYVPIPPYPLRAIAAQIHNARGPGGSQKRGAAAGGSDDDGPTAKSQVESLRNGPPQREENAAHAISAAGSWSPTRRSQIGGGYSIDKSALAMPSERRLRSKAHRVMVAARSCIVCEETPCHAHHITFAQPRGLSLKVSDEFTVPLCVKHHNDVHAKGNEAGWWRAQGIDPLDHAQQLWEVTAGLLSDRQETPNGDDQQM